MKRHTAIWKQLMSGSCWAAALLFGSSLLHAAPREGLALAIVYDTSGSMLQTVRDREGRPTPKHVIASRALDSILDRLTAISSSAGAPRSIHICLVALRGNRATMAVPFGPFDPDALRRWIKEQGKPQAGTPLGDGVRLAGRPLLSSPFARKHVLVITDGINTQGPTPVATISELQRQAKAKEASLSFHFVAFDIEASVFKPVKDLGATVVGAADEAQLNSQLEFILEKKILLEDEELPSVNEEKN